MIGTILALEWNAPGNYFESKLTSAISFFQNKGLVIRPLGNVLYLIPPYCSTPDDLEKCYSAMEEYLNLPV